MRPFFTYQTRNATRDLETDTKRLSKLTTLLDQISDEVTSEQSGLQKRYKEEVTDASFLMTAEENEGVSTDKDNRLQDITSSVTRSEQRLADLKGQLLLLNNIKRDMEAKFIP